MRHYKSVTVALLALCGSAAHAQNIVGNPGFETGTASNFAPWTHTQTLNFLTQNDNNVNFARTGTHSGELLSTDVAGSGSISQTLTTVSLQTYTLDFWLNNRNGTRVGGTDPFTVQWNGSPLPGINLPNDSLYHEYTFTVAATGTSTVLEFDSPTMGSPWQINLDDVSAKALVTPEPGSFALLLTSAVTGVGLVARRRRTARKVV